MCSFDANLTSIYSEVPKTFCGVLDFVVQSVKFCDKGAEFCGVPG